MYFTMHFICIIAAAIHTYTHTYIHTKYIIIYIYKFQLSIKGHSVIISYRLIHSPDEMGILI